MSIKSSGCHSKSDLYDKGNKFASYRLTKPCLFCYKCKFLTHKVAWPSGKAEACKASIPSSNLGAT